MNKLTLSTLVLFLSIGIASGQENQREEVQIPEILEKPFDIIKSRAAIGSGVGVKELLTSGSVEILDSNRESKIKHRPTRTDWSTDPEGCSDTIFEYPKRKSSAEVIAAEKASPPEKVAEVQGEFVAWLGEDNKTYVLFSQLGIYEFSTVWEIQGWEAEDAWKAWPYFGRACVVVSDDTNLEEMFKTLQDIAIIGNYSF